jgi:hypothetical protein
LSEYAGTRLLPQLRLREKSRWIGRNTYAAGAANIRKPFAVTGDSP